MTSPNREVARVCLRSNDINTLYIWALKALTHGLYSAPRGMPITETLAPQIILEDPRSCLVTIPKRKLNHRFAIAEWLWIASGSDSVESIAPYCAEIKNYSDNGNDFFGAYGPRWRPQVERVIELLRSDPDSRQGIVSTWRNNDEWLKWIESNVTLSITKDVPCTLTTQYVIREGELVTLVNMRSWDAWLGFPYDMFNFSMLGSIVAAELNVKQGPVCVTAGSLHLYDRDKAKAEELIEYQRHSPFTWEAPKMPAADCLPAVGLMRWREIMARQGILYKQLAEPWKSYYSVLAQLEPHRLIDLITPKSRQQ